MNEAQSAFAYGEIIVTTLFVLLLWLGLSAVLGLLVGPFLRRASEAQERIEPGTDWSKHRAI